MQSSVGQRRRALIAQGRDMTCRGDENVAEGVVGDVPGEAGELPADGLVVIRRQHDLEHGMRAEHWRGTAVHRATPLSQSQRHHMAAATATKVRPRTTSTAGMKYRR